jgi:hypothetical protein
MSTQIASSDLLKDTGITNSQSTSLPVTRNLTLAYAFSLVIAVIMAVVAAAGLLFPGTVYPTDEVIMSFAPVDAFHLVVGLPVLLDSLWLARRGKLIGLLCWPGALLYLLYSYITNLVGVPFGILFLPYLLLVTLSAYTTVGLVASIDSEAVRQRLNGNVPARVAGGILFGLTILFIILNVSAVITALTSQPPGEPEHPVYVLIADFTVVIPTCLVGGLLLWRRQALGHVGGAGLLLMYSLLFAGLIPVMVFPTFYDASPMPVVDIVMIFIWCIMCFILFVLFVRGITRS